MEDYQKRLIVEYIEIKERLSRLSDFLDRVSDGEAFTDCPFELLTEQEKIMKRYKNILINRSYYEHIPLYEYDSVKLDDNDINVTI